MPDGIELKDIFFSELLIKVFEKLHIETQILKLSQEIWELIFSFLKVKSQRKHCDVVELASSENILLNQH